MMMRKPNPYLNGSQVLPPGMLLKKDNRLLMPVAPLNNVALIIYVSFYLRLYIQTLINHINLLVPMFYIYKVLVAKPLNILWAYKIWHGIVHFVAINQTIPVNGSYKNIEIKIADISWKYCSLFCPRYIFPCLEHYPY